MMKTYKTKFFLKNQKFFYLLLFATSLSLIVYVLANNALESNSSLVLVHVVFRHGARTPSNFYKNDPYKNHTFNPFGLGQLTNEGKEQAYQLGKFLRKHYISFIGDNFSNEKFYVRSRDVLRLRTTALLVLAGLFPPTNSFIWNKELNWHPIPVDYVPLDQEMLMTPQGNCYNLTYQILQDILNTKEYKNDILKPFQETFDIINNYTGEKYASPYDILTHFITLNSEKDFGYQLPEWTNLIYPEKIEAVAASFYSFTNISPFLKKINGELLKKIVHDSMDKISGKLTPSQRKIFMYSAHDINLGHLIDIFKLLEKPTVPDYASALSFELHKIDDNFFMKVRYRRSKTSSYFEDLVISGCAPLCPIADFFSIAQEFYLATDVEEACNAYNKVFKK